MIRLNRNIVRDKIHACWIGKNIGGTMGQPYECKTTMNDIQGFSTPKGEVIGNDDLDLQLVWLKAIEDHGPDALTEQTLGEYWMSYIPPHWNEYGQCKANMKLGLLPPLCGEYNNKWKHSNGAWIRTEVWACMAPAAPDVAIRYAQMDACVDHGSGEGTYAAMFVAAMESAAFVIDDLRELIEIGLTKIPQNCRMARAVKLVCDCYDNGVDWVETRERLVKDSEDLGWFMAPANVGFALLGMLYGEGDFKKSMILAINCGDDTDCTAATLGSLFGIMHGTAGIPADWSEHIGDTIVTKAVDRSMRRLPKTCTELTNRVYNMIPLMLGCNRAPVCLADEDAIPAEDAAKFRGGDLAAGYAAIPGNSVNFKFIWGSCRVVLPDGPECEPGKPVKVQFRVSNNDPSPKPLTLTWHLPEGWTVTGVKKHIALPHLAHASAPKTTFEAEIIPGDNVEASNRIVLVMEAAGRPVAAMIPIVLIG